MKEHGEKVGLALRGRVGVLKGRESLLKNKTYEEIYGEDKALEQKSKRSLAMHGKKHRITKKYDLTDERRNELKEWMKQIRLKRPKLKHSEETKNKIKESCKSAYKNRKRYCSSKSELAFLKKCEDLFSINLERQFELGNRFFDARYKNILIEVDGKYWHKYDKVNLNDELKEQIAQQNGFKLYRFEINGIKEIDNKISLYHDTLNEIFKGVNDNS